MRLRADSILQLYGDPLGTAEVLTLIADALALLNWKLPEYSGPLPIVFRFMTCLPFWRVSRSAASRRVPQRTLGGRGVLFKNPATAVDRWREIEPAKCLLWLHKKLDA